MHHRVYILHIVSGKIAKSGIVGGVHASDLIYALNRGYDRCLIERTSRYRPLSELHNSVTPQAQQAQQAVQWSLTLSAQPKAWKQRQFYGNSDISATEEAWFDYTVTSETALEQSKRRRLIVQFRITAEEPGSDLSVHNSVLPCKRLSTMLDFTFLSTLASSRRKVANTSYAGHSNTYASLCFTGGAVGIGRAQQVEVIRS